MLSESLINRILESISRLIDKRESTDSSVLGFPFYSEVISLKGELAVAPGILAQSFNSTPLLYWKDRKSNIEITALGEVYTSSNILDTDRACQWIQKESLMAFYSFGQFDQRAKKGEEWKAFAPYLLYLPALEFRNKRELVVNIPAGIYKGRTEKKRFINYLKSLLLNPRRPLKSFWEKTEHVIETPNRDQWEEMVEEVLRSIKNQEVRKVVLARRKTHSFLVPPTFEMLLGENLSVYPGQYVCYFRPDALKAFISLSPEMLFQTEIDKKKITVDAIAGTRERDLSNPENDINLKEDLLKSQKDILEHEIVIDGIVRDLSKVCKDKDISVTKRRAVRKFQHVQHLCSQIVGTLKESATLAQILEVLHPTPAVGGMSKMKAMEIIRNLSGFDRGLYAAPIGRISQEGIEYLVGIRSALIDDLDLHIYGGAGIVEGSSGSEEWQEIENKMATFSGLC